MPLGETLRGETGEPFSSGERSDSQTNRDKERTEERRQKALTYLIETGRATTPEEAERYLTSLSHLKERLISSLRDIIPQTQRGEPRMPSEYPPCVFSVEPHLAGGNKEVREPIQAVLRPEQLDRLNPRLWSLKITVAPAELGPNVTIRDHTLLLPMVDRTIGIAPHGYLLADHLNSQLSLEERELLVKEYDCSVRDLIRQLRERAGDLEEDQTPIVEFWEPLLEASEKAPRG